jgi:putative CocE/NonD family hydrolase
LRSRGAQQLLIGPWLHGRLNKTNKVGELVYPENAHWPELDHMVRWFDHWLKGSNNGVQNEPTVRYYVMGATGEEGAPGNVWRSAGNWPPSHKTTSFYLATGNLLQTSAPETVSDNTILPSDPLHPVEIAGRAFPGAKDARSVEAQKDVRTWTTMPLENPLEITGEVKAEVWIQTSVKDTDLILRVSDVYPDGRSMLLMDYPMRARYREGFEHQKLLVPDEPALLSWHIGWTSIIINKGHRLRVTLTCTGAPLYEPNPQSGGPQTANWMQNAQSASHKILHNKIHASRILLPLPEEPFK